MNEILKTPEPADTRTWIGRVLIGVILGEAVWGFLVSLTTNLVLPAMARFMGGDPQSPLYLGKGDFNVAGLFIAILELCFAGIVAVALNAWTQKGTPVRVKTVRVASIPAPPAIPAAPRPTASAAVPASMAPVEPITTTPSEAGEVMPSVPPPPAAPQTPSRAAQAAPPKPGPQPAKPAKPKRPKEVYYNIVGEPIESDDE
jgi:hypothetical protein